MVSPAATRGTVCKLTEKEGKGFGMQNDEAKALWISAFKHEQIAMRPSGLTESYRSITSGPESAPLSFQGLLYNRQPAPLRRG